MLIVKVFLLSAVISLFIKYIGPSLAIAPTPVNALIAVFTPSILVILFLLKNR